MKSLNLINSFIFCLIDFQTYFFASIKFLNKSIKPVRNLNKSLNLINSSSFGHV